MLLTLLECFTGVVLMVYYVPTPEGSYQSIIRILSDVPFGWLMRDLHRIGAECMIAVVILHFIRVFLSGTYHKKSSLTWVSGVLLLVCTLFLGFSGYLLPWDQLSYWAVTIGTSVADTIPVIGGPLSEVLRGGKEFGQDGLLRFYLLHILGIPVVLGILLAIHYYRVSRICGVSMPINKEREDVRYDQQKKKSKRIPFFPLIPLQELVLFLLVMITLISVVTFFYDAPLGSWADPRHTPAHTRAPWFFLWLQGALKYGNSFIMGVCFPGALLALFLTLPYFDRTERKTLRKRPAAITATVLLSSVFGMLTISGLPSFGLQEDGVSAILQRFNPEEERSPFHDIVYEQLPIGIWETGLTNDDDFKESSFGQLLESLSGQVQELIRVEKKIEPKGIIIVEDWQADLKKITVRIHWHENGTATEPTSVETTVYVKR